MLETIRDRAIRDATAVAIVLRAVWAFFVPIAPVSDSAAYDTLAMNLARFGTYGWQPGEASAYWPPGTAFLYSLLYRVFGHVYWPIAVLNVILGALVVVLAAHLARVWFGERAARCTAIVLAVWPSLIFYTTVLASELPFIVLTLAALASFLAAPNRWEGWIVTGILFGLASYVRTEALLLGSILFFARPPSLSFPRRALAVAVIFVIVGGCVTPWLVRNARAYGGATFMTTSAGQNFWMGNNEHSTGDYMEVPEAGDRDPVAFDRELRDRALAYVRAHPWRFVRNTLVKSVRMYERETIGFTWAEEGLRQRLGRAQRLALKYGGQAYWLFVLVAAVVGLARGVARERGRALLHPSVLYCAYITAIHAVTIALQDRFHFPASPFVAMFASGPILEAVDRVAARSAAPKGTVVGSRGYVFANAQVASPSAGSDGTSATSERLTSGVPTSVPRPHEIPGPSGQGDARRLE